MTTTRPLPALVLVVVGALTGAPSRAAAQDNCPSFTPGLFSANGMNGIVHAFANYDDGSGTALYAGGQFTFAGRSPKNRVARWDGAEWRALGSGLDGPVFALAVFEGSLYAGGAFSRAGGVAASNVARWNGVAWSAVGQGVDKPVRALAVWDDGLGPALFAGGDFERAGLVPARRIARFDGVTWRALGSGIGSAAPDSVLALVPHDDGSGPALYVGGQFARAGESDVAHLARWDGAAFSSVGGGLSARASALAVWDGALHVGGAFQEAGSPATYVGRVARWDGQRFSQLAAGVNLGEVMALHAHDDGTGSRLYVGGTFDGLYDASGASRIASWDGVDFHPLATGVNGVVAALATFDDGTGPRLGIGGDFVLAGDLAVERVAFWNGAAWVPCGTGGSSRPIEALLSFDDGTGSALYAAGSFLSASGEPLERIARWNGREWSPVGAGLPDFVFALETFDDGTGRALYAGGDSVNGSPSVSRWDGSNWTGLGAGLNNNVFALAEFDDGSGPALYAGGIFGRGSDPLRGIARWDGSAWQSVGGGVAGSVNALSVFDDGVRRVLVAGGSFSSAGGTAVRDVAAWDGVAWSPLGPGLGSNVVALHSFDDGSGNALYAGGLFQISGASPALRIARWNGFEWRQVGDGLSDAVLAMTSFDDGTGPALYVAGRFTASGGRPIARIAKWDGSAFQPLGSGISDQVYALAAHHDSGGAALFAGGYFRSAGGVSSSRIARFADPCGSCRAGNVNAGGGGPRVDVLFVNDSNGGAARRLEITSFQPLSIFMASPPAATGPARFALYAWEGDDDPAGRRALPQGLGTTCLPTPLSGGSPRLRVIWNNTGKSVLGAATRPSSPAPSSVLDIRRGVGRQTTFVIQGLIADPNSIGSRPASVTNALVVVVR